VTSKHFIIATAGHVDHGKSTLVKALTGTDPDRLPEEKKRQITIDLGFAALDVTAPNGDKIHAGIVDVPGHEDFVRNMIAGVGSIDLALFVVAADDGWMPQSEEHLQILNYLGVQQIVVALTKCDLAGSDIVTAQIREELQTTSFAKCQIIPTSIRTGEGIEQLKQALACELATLRPPRDIGKPRLFVDRAFTLRGVGTVVTGTLTRGTLRRGENVVIQPRNLSARVRSIQNHGRDIEIAQPGMRTAVNLPDLSLNQIKRGDVVTIPGLGAANSRVIAMLEKSSRFDHDNPAMRPLKHRASVYMHHGSARVLAKIVFADAQSLAPGERKIAQIKIQSPLFAFLGDRFVLRDASERYTIGGGTVLNAAATESPNLRETARKISMTPATVSQDIDLCVRSELETCDFVEAKTLLSQSHFSAADVAGAVSRLAEEGAIIHRAGIVASMQSWQNLFDLAAALIDDAHRNYPERRGLELSEIRAALPEGSTVFEALVEDLCQSEFVRAGTAIGRKSYRPTLQPQIRPAADKIRAALEASAVNPPSRKDVARDKESEAALRFLIEQGEVAELSCEIVLLSNVLQKMRETVVAFISKHGPASASELRQELGSSRRIVIPFLEYLDCAGITRRIGDKRALGRMGKV
jgi:selenocysteine-specific elongation factor